MKQSDVEARTILRCLVGSTVHGLALEGTDDRDEMGIMVEPPEAVTGLDWFEHYVTRTKPEGVRSGPGDLDLCIYGLRKWMRLAVKGNPTIILPLFVPAMHCLVINKYGHELRHFRKHIISKRAGACFKGYLLQQKLRLLGLRGQKRVKRPELEEKYGYDTKYAMHALRLGYQGVELMTCGNLSLPMREDERGVLMQVRRGEVSKDKAVQMIEAMDQSLSDAMAKSHLPEAPDMGAVNGWLHRLYMDHWTRASAESR